MTPIPLTDTSRPPQFPCWCWSDIFKKWGNVAHMGTILALECTHWHPDQPDAPAERPEEVDSTFADQLRAECSKMTPEQRKQAYEYGMKMINQSSDNRQAESANRQSDTPRTDAAEESDSYAFQILYPHMKYRGVKGDRMRILERELAELNEQLQARVLDLADMTQGRDKIMGELRALEQEVADLKRWKAEALFVESTWDVQKVGVLLGLPLGSDIRSQIEPGILRLTKEVSALRADRDRLDWLQRFLQLGGSSVFTTCTGRAQEPRDDDTDDTRWNHPFCIGHEVEVEHRGCYRWEELSNGSRGIRAAIDAAMEKQQQEGGV